MIVQGLPLPLCDRLTGAAAAGQPSSCCALLLSPDHSATKRSLPNTADVVPVTGVDSNLAENFFIASTPQAFATVVLQCPCSWRPSAPRTSRGTSGSHFGSLNSASRARFAFTSPLIISHHKVSFLSVEKPMVVPW